MTTTKMKIRSDSPSRIKGCITEWHSSHVAHDNRLAREIAGHLDERNRIVKANDAESLRRKLSQISSGTATDI